MDGMASPTLHGVALKPGCQLIHGQFAMLVQLFLGMLSLGSLGVKVMTAYALPGRSFCLAHVARTRSHRPLTVANQTSGTSSCAGRASRAPGRCGSTTLPRTHAPLSARTSLA